MAIGGKGMQVLFTMRKAPLYNCMPRMGALSLAKLKNCMAWVATFADSTKRAIS